MAGAHVIVGAGMAVANVDVTGHLEALVARADPVDRRALADPATPLESLI